MFRLEDIEGTITGLQKQNDKMLRKLKLLKEKNSNLPSGTKRVILRIN